MKKCKILMIILALLTLSGCALAQIEQKNGAGARPKEGTQTLYETKLVQVETYPLIARIYPWTERSNDDRFPSFVHEGIEYVSAGKLETAEDDRILATLGEVTLEGYDPIKKVEYETTASVCPIEGIDSAYALMLSFEGDSACYVYRNHDYTVETLGELIDALDLSQTISFGSAYENYFDAANEYISLEFVGAEQERVWELLFSDRAIKVSDYDDRCHDRVRTMSISVNAPLLGHSNKSLTVTEGGYLWTNLIDTGIAFYIGEDRAEAFMHYLTSECKGYQIIYDYGNSGIESEGTDDAKPHETTVHYRTSPAPEASE